MYQMYYQTTVCPECNGKSKEIVQTVQEIELKPLTTNAIRSFLRIVFTSIYSRHLYIIPTYMFSHFFKKPNVFFKKLLLIFFILPSAITSIMLWDRICRILLLKRNTAPTFQNKKRL